MNQIIESNIVQNLSPQFQMNSQTEVCSNIEMLPKDKTVCICTSYNQIRVLLNLISDS
jgi:hypothetical protein